MRGLFRVFDLGFPDFEGLGFRASVYGLGFRDTLEARKGALFNPRFLGNLV